MGKYFGTDGFRGEANKQLTVEHAFKVGRFIGWYYGAARDKSCKVVIGKDTRRSSYMFEYALVAGLTASGQMFIFCMLLQHQVWLMWCVRKKILTVVL